MNTKLLVNGKLTKGKGDDLGVLDPATGKVIVHVNEASEEQIAAAVQAAAKAFPGWAATVPKDRATLLLKLADRIEAEGAEFAKLESQNCGKPYAAALNDEIPAVADVFRFFAGAARTMHGALAGEYLPGFTSMIRRDPIGVVASIAPWNYPLMMAAWKMAPALAAGNTVVLKPSEQTPLTALKLATHPRRAVSAGRREHHLRPRQYRRRAAGRAAGSGDDLADRRCLDAARRCSRPRPRAPSARISSSAARRPSSCSTTRTWNRVVSGVRTFGFYNAGPGLHGRLPHLRGPEDLRQARRGSVRCREQHQGRRAGRRGRRDGPVDHGQATLARVRIRATRRGEAPHRDHHGRQGALRRRILLRAHRHRRREADRRDRAERSVRPGSQRHALQGRRPGHRVGERLRLRSRLIGVDEGRVRRR